MAKSRVFKLIVGERSGQSVARALERREEASRRAGDPQAIGAPRATRPPRAGAPPRAAGALRPEGRDYEMQDGDVVEFLFSK